MVDVRMEVAGGVVSLVSRMLTLLGVEAAVVRGANAGGWHTSRPRWTLVEHWLDPVPEPAMAVDGYRPGAPVAPHVRARYRGRHRLVVWIHEGGGARWRWPSSMLWRSRSTAAPPAGCCPTTWASSKTLVVVALLPVLDPTVMGWKGRVLLPRPPP